MGALHILKMASLAASHMDAVLAYEESTNLPRTQLYQGRLTTAPRVCVTSVLVEI